MLYPIQNDRRNKLDLSGIWDFHIDPEGKDAVNRWMSGLPASHPIAAVLTGKIKTEGDTAAMMNLQG